MLIQTFRKSLLTEKNHNNDRRVASGVKLHRSEHITPNSKSTYVLFWVEAVGSNPAGPTTRPTGPTDAKIFRTLWELRKGGQSEDTLRARLI
ncbi:MAG: hypothetical protein JSV57_03215, partial [Candidatus Bathyarchaeota archaeon]